jgi:hypothetical protein
VKPKVEAPQQFNKPLMNQRFRQDDQCPPNPARENQAMQNKARLDRLPQPNFIGQQHPRHKPARHLGHNTKLVGNQIDSSPDEAPHPRFAAPMLLVQRRHPEIERLRRIDLGRQQTFLGFVETDRVTEFRFTKFPLTVAIKDEPVPLCHGLND